MTALFVLVLAGLGFVGAFVSGLLGVGGAIVMIILTAVRAWYDVLSR